MLTVKFLAPLLANQFQTSKVEYRNTVCGSTAILAMLRRNSLQITPGKFL